MLHKAQAFTARVTRQQLSAVTERYSDSGYTNIHGDDIIIDLVHVEEDRQEFADLIGVPLEELPQDGLITVHP